MKGATKLADASTLTGLSSHWREADFTLLISVSDREQIRATSSSRQSCLFLKALSSPFPFGDRYFRRGEIARLLEGSDDMLP